MSNELRGEALCVRVLWGERRVATHLIHPGRKLALGFTGEAVTPSQAPLQFEAGSRYFSLNFQEGVVGELLRNAETPLSLGDAVHRGLAVEEEKGWSFDIGRCDVLRLGKGPVRVEAFRVRAPVRAVGTAEDIIDYGFLNTLLVCSALFMVGVMSAQLNEGTGDDEGVVSRDVTRMRNILVKAEKPQPKLIAAAATADATKVPLKKPVAEGKPKAPSKPVKDPGGSRGPTALQLANALFAGGPGASGVLGPGGLGKDLEGALGHVVAVNGDGMGGWSIRGNGAGGINGDPVQIGSPLRSGIGLKKGIGELCHGPGPCKTSVPPSITSDPPFMCSQESGGASCMDKELIRKVINGHRDQIRFCYELALQKAPALAGKVSVQFAVVSSGMVAAARVENSSAGSEALGDCLVSRVRSWQFPVGARSAGFRVTYPFVFKPSGT